MEKLSEKEKEEGYVGTTTTTPSSKTPENPHPKKTKKKTTTTTTTTSLDSIGEMPVESSFEIGSEISSTTEMPLEKPFLESDSNKPEIVCINLIKVFIQKIDKSNKYLVIIINI